MSEQQQVGCEREDGTLNVHPESESCEVCAPPPARAAADLRERTERFLRLHNNSYVLLTRREWWELSAALSHAEQAQAELSEWRLGHMADATGHLFRCAKVNGQWSCAEGCAVKRAEQAERACATLRAENERLRAELALERCPFGSDDPDGECGCYAHKELRAALARVPAATKPFDTRIYRLAPSGEGPLAAEWQDKPHRLIYDLCAEIERRDGVRLGPDNLPAAEGKE